MPEPKQPFGVVEAGDDVHVDQQRGHRPGCRASQQQGRLSKHQAHYAHRRGDCDKVPTACIQRVGEPE